MFERRQRSAIIMHESHERSVHACMHMNRRTCQWYQSLAEKGSAALVMVSAHPSALVSLSMHVHALPVQATPALQTQS